MVHVSSTIQKIKNQPSNSTSCSDNTLRLLVLVACILYQGLQVMSSSFSMWGCVLKGCFDRGIFLKAKIAFERHFEDFNLEHYCSPHCSLFLSHVISKVLDYPVFRAFLGRRQGGPLICPPLNPLYGTFHRDHLCPSLIIPLVSNAQQRPSGRMHGPRKKRWHGDTSPTWEKFGVYKYKQEVYCVRGLNWTVAYKASVPFIHLFLHPTTYECKTLY